MRALATAARRATASRFAVTPAASRGYGASSDDEALNRRPANPEKGFTAALFPGDGGYGGMCGVEWGEWGRAPAPARAAGGREGRNRGREGNRNAGGAARHAAPPPTPLQVSAPKSRTR